MARRRPTNLLTGNLRGSAKQIIQNRPYTSTHDLVKSGVMTEHQFDEIGPKVTVH